MEKFMKNFFLQVLLSFVWLQITHQTANDVNTKLIYSWKLVDFAYPTQQRRTEAIENEDFIPENTIIIDSDFYISQNSNQVRFFVTTPSLKAGNPITLSEVSNEKDDDTDLLRPFPSWEMNDKRSCQSLISVYRIQVDKCGHLWVVDAGTIEVSRNDEITCPPKILIYDLKNNDLELVRYELDREAYKVYSVILNLVIESYTNDCSDSIAYMADTRGTGIIMYNQKENISWRVDHHRFSLYPDDVTFTVEGETLNTSDGVFGLALGPPTENTRLLYWHSFGSLKESWISTDILLEREPAPTNKILNEEIITSEPAREGQSTVEIMTDNGILIYVLITKNALACWNSITPFTADNQHIIYQDNENFQFITGLKLRDKELIITSCMLQKAIVGTLDPNEVKYRIISIDNVDALLKGTPCII